MLALKGKIAIVTGASRSAGRGIALVLGEAGATVYVTGRSVRGGPTTNHLPETIDETAEMVTARGGVGISMCVDHTVDEQVEILFERVKQEQGQLDILVNNSWGGYEDTENYSVAFWDQPLWRWEKMFTAGVRTHFTASRLAVPLMMPQRWGLIVNTTFWVPGKYLNHVLYDVAKTAVNRLTLGMAVNVRDHNIAAVALSPGVLRNEYMMRGHLREHGSIEQQTWPKDSFLWKTESTEYIGRAVVALATDPNVMEKSGMVFTVGDLAREYGFTDIDGRQVPPFHELFPEEFKIDAK